LDEEVNYPRSLYGFVRGGVEESSLGSGGGVGLSSSWSSCSSLWKRWRWVVEVSTISISDSAVWNSHGLSKLSTDGKNKLVVSDITDSLCVCKGQTDWFTTVILGSNVDSLGRVEEPTFDGLTVKSSSVFTLRSSSECASSLCTSGSNGSVAPLWLGMSIS